MVLFGWRKEKQDKMRGWGDQIIELPQTKNSISPVTHKRRGSSHPNRLQRWSRTLNKKKITKRKWFIFVFGFKQDCRILTGECWSFIINTSDMIYWIWHAVCTFVHICIAKETELMKRMCMWHWVYKAV